jgi:hypothetical protein
MIIMHNFGDGDRITDVYVAALEDGTYAVRWDPASKALKANRKVILTDEATFSDADMFDFTDDELGLVGEEA